MFKKLKDIAQATVAVVRGKDKNAPIKQPKKKRISKDERTKRLAQIEAEKQKATELNKEYFTVVDFDVDYDNISNGSFEFEWNDIFITRLMRAGYVGTEDADLVDQWFTAVCRNVVRETYEQEQADPQNRKLADGRREYK